MGFIRLVPLKMSIEVFLVIILCTLVSHQCNAEAKMGEHGMNLTHTAYGVLASKGFPSGLLPNSVSKYFLNKSSGEFSVHFNRRCDIILPPDNYPASFSKTIRGKLTEGYIQELSGIRVKAYFKWWSITGIRSKGEKLVFEVGMVSVEYPSANFDESPDCGGSSHSSA